MKKAVIFPNWAQGIKEYLTDPAERCAVYEYIIAYQLQHIPPAIPAAGEVPENVRGCIIFLEAFLHKLKERGAR